MKKPKKSKTPKVKTTAEDFQSIQAKHEFTDQELRELTDKHLRKLQEIDSIGATAKQVAADYKAQLKRTEAESYELRNKLTNRYELRPTECKVHYDAKRRMKSFIRVDNGALVTEEAMTNDDFQTWFPLPVETKPVAKPSEAPALVVMPPAEDGHAKDLVSMANALTDAEKKAAKKVADAKKRADLKESPESEE